MPDYSKSKIYKLQCEDGHFYIGSTTSTLASRFASHKTNMANTTIYNHIRNLGWDKVKIVLVEEYPCENKEHLRKKEDEHIQSNLSNPYCLNVYRAYQSEDNRKEYCKQKSRERYEIRRQEILDYGKKYRENNKDALREYQRKYREENRERICERDRLYRQRKSSQV